MADFSTIIQEINAEITTNGVGAITGAKLNEVLRDMLAAVNAEKQDPLTIDPVPTEASTNPVQSGGVYDFLQSKATLYYVEDITDIPPTILNRLQVGDVVRFGNDFMAGAIVAVIENGQMWLVVPTDRFEVFVYDNGSYFGNATYNLSDFATKVAGANNGNFAGLDADGNLTDSGSKASDFATASQGGKADTAVQQVTVGTTTTGNAGTNASVTNSGTATAPVLDFTIPRGADGADGSDGADGADGSDGADAVNPFKGMFITMSDTNIPTTGTAGDYIFIADANPATTIDLYFWNTAATPAAWADTGYDINPGSLAEFAQGPAVSMVRIINDMTTGGSTNVASAETVKSLNLEVNGGDVTVYDEISWSAWNSFNGTRRFKVASEKSLEGDIVRAQLNDATNYTYAVAIKSVNDYGSGIVYDTGWISTDIELVIDSQYVDYYVRFAIAKQDNSSISATEAENALSLLTYERPRTIHQQGLDEKYSNAINNLDEKYSNAINNIDSELWGGQVDRIADLTWDDARKQTGRERVFVYLNDTTEAGDVVLIRLNDYTSYKCAITILDSKSYAQLQPTLAYDSGWKTSDFSVVVTNELSGKYLRVSIAKANDAAITVEEAISAISEIKASRELTYDTVGLVSRVDALENPIVDGEHKIGYLGQRVIVKQDVNQCGYTKIGDINNNNLGYLQGGASYGDYLFQFHTSNAGIDIFNLRTKEQTFTTLTPNSNNHAGSGAFGIEKYDENDYFPLLYIASMDEKKIYVYRVTESSGVFSFTIVQTITLDVDFYLPAIAIDKSYQRLVVAGYKLNSWSTATNNECYLCYCDIPTLSSGDVIVTQFYNKKTIDYIYAIQGMDSNSGYLYMGYGNTVSEGGIQVWDVNNGQLLSKVDVSNIGSVEPESLCIWGKSLVMVLAGRQIYKFNF